MADRDANKEALDQVERVTDSKRVEGADLLESPELKRQLREAKKRLIAPDEANSSKAGPEKQKDC